MEKLDTIKNMAEVRISLWIRIHERMQEEQRRLENERVLMTGTPFGERAAA